VAERERDLERFLTFVDAVVAIAITLLVLPLAEIGKEVRTGEVAGLLGAHTDYLLGFVLSFVVIARLWLGQHAIVATLVRQSPAVVRLLLTWTFTIVFLPFPTALVTSTSQDGVAKVLYLGTMAASSALLALIAWVIGRDRSLRDRDEKPGTLHATARTVAFLVALAVSTAFPVTSYWPLLLLAVTDPVADGLRRRHRRNAVS
jgi:uncharacterized membrane protein